MIGKGSPGALTIDSILGVQEVRVRVRMSSENVHTWMLRIGVTVLRADQNCGLSALSHVK